MKDGIIVINKPQNWTSHDCVAVCRKVLKRKVGHGGTLDPMAEGVLPVFAGKATRIMEYTDPDYKTYAVTAKLGLMTDTQDIWGDPLKTEDHVDLSDDRMKITAERITRALESFAGEIEQIPPMYSALKHKGKRLYEYAREGKSVPIRSRKVHIKNITINNIDLQKMEVDFEVECSKGTYVRTICSDLGNKLECGGVLKSLKRLRSGIFDLSLSLDPNDVKKMDMEALEAYMLPVDLPLVNFGSLKLKKEIVKDFINGMSVDGKEVDITDEGICAGERRNGRNIPYRRIYKVYGKGTGIFLGTGRFDEGMDVLRADKIFITRQDYEDI